ncbi:hypothetical protein Tco_0803551 [Tanacetum coccineum]|uniref:Uncharacterized protein n=1 Tax=Tanacetum coccineum TaxID=301880 RepID=A0ABQ5A224_9ASTR
MLAVLSMFFSEDDDDENYSEDENNDYGNDDDGNDGDGDDADNQEDDVTYDDDEETGNDRTKKLLNLENPSLADNEITSLMDTIVCHEELRSQTSSLYTIPITATPNVTSVFTITIPPPPPFFNPLPQQETPTPTPTTYEATTLFPSLPYFLSVFKFNDRVTKLEKDLEAIQKAIVAHNLDCREEAQAEKRDYIELVDTSIRAILKEEVNTQLPQILPQAVLDFATPMIEKNVTESLEAAILARSSSQLKSTYEAAASLSEFELTKILIDKMGKNKSYDKVDYKRELYDAPVKSYQTDKDLFDTYGELRKEAESSRDSRSKENKSSNTYKVASHSQHKHSGKYACAVELSYTVDDSGVQQYQEFGTGNNDEQPADKEFSKADWFKKLERPPTPDPDWNKRQHVDLRPPQTWISQVSRAKEPTTSFDELLNTPIDFSTFVLNRLNIKEVTQAILVGPAFELLKGTCKNLTELKYHLEECSKDTSERLDWHNPKGKPYLFDLNKPLLLIRDHRGRQVIPQDFFINNDLEYLKGGYLRRRCSTSVTKTKAATYEIKWIEDLVQNLWSPVKVIYDKHAYWGTSHWGPKRQHFYGFAANMSSSKDVYSRKQIITVTRLTIMKKYDYGHLEEIEVRREDQKLYKFREDERHDLNVALRMFTKRINIQRRVEDLQLGVESYQKKLNLTKPNTFRSNLRNKTAYTAYLDPKGMIYKDQNNRNKLMRADELHKFSDGTLNDVRTALHDIAKGIRME